jgi:hypothetical protein
VSVAVLVELEEQRVFVAVAWHDLLFVAGLLELVRAFCERALYVVVPRVNLFEERRAGAAELGEERVDQDDVLREDRRDQLREGITEGDSLAQPVGTLEVV